MKIQIASDLHHEMSQHCHELACPLPLAPGADALVLAGDIHEGTNAIDIYSDYPVPVVYVHGNHEPLNNRYPALISDLEDRAVGTAVRFLQNDQFTFGEIRFLGACMWTDYLQFPLHFNDSLEIARHGMIEHKLVRRSGDGRMFQPEDARMHQRETLLWLREQLDVPFLGKTIVVTHHIPSPRSIPHAHQQHALAPAYASNLELLVERADLWIHGHAHWSCDYRIGKCRVICNPRGRPGRNRKYPELPYENAEFQPALTVDV
ncbi:metallophosphoesterase [Paraburkholderia phytofirmans]|nr:metallophosphoesterase [Paraburkholderia phytofirmans]